MVCIISTCFDSNLSSLIVDVKGGGDDSPELLAKVHQLLEQSNPDVLAYAARLEDDNYIKEYLASCPNEVSGGHGYSICTTYIIAEIPSAYVVVTDRNVE